MGGRRRLTFLNAARVRWYDDDGYRVDGVVLQQIYYSIFGLWSRRGNGEIKALKVKIDLRFKIKGVFKIIDF